MDTIVCIENKLPVIPKSTLGIYQIDIPLVVGKQYKVYTTIEDKFGDKTKLYKVINELDLEGYYNAKLFVSLQEYREQQLNALFDA